MGLTSDYDLPFPDADDFVDQGAADIEALAQAVRLALLPPLLVTTGDGSTAWSGKVAEIGWNAADDANRKRGSWDSTGGDDQLIIPSEPGWYWVTSTIRFGGKAEPDWYDLEIRTRQQGAGVGTGTRWAGVRVEQPANPTSFTELAIAGMVRIPETTPRTGVAIRASYNGANNPPDVGADVNRLSIFRWSAL